MAAFLYPLQTDQQACYDEKGREIPCAGSGQDGETRFGIGWPEPRFDAQGDDVVLDRLTGLYWTRNANPGGFPMTWQESLDFIARLNVEKAFGHADWRLPNRRELRSLVSCRTRKPALPEGHPFTDYFLGWYWSSTTAAISPAYAWYVHLEGARMFYGRKDQYYLLWPVRGAGSAVLPQTGQTGCFDAGGDAVRCMGSGQDGEFRLGVAWPEPRFATDGEVAVDRLTGLCWLKNADITGRPVCWEAALAAVRQLNRRGAGGRTDWQLPNINALESLVDCSRHSPALPAAHPFTGLRDAYWSSTTSFFETDWSWALYLEKGAVGVGHKQGSSFFVWPVCYPAGGREKI